MGIDRSGQTKAWQKLCDNMGYEFQNPRLLELALTHSSWANEKGHGGQHNERLEFLGDAVLELCVSTELYKRYPHAREGELTRMRSRLVSEKSLAEIARKNNLDEALLLGAGEERQGGRKRDAILCDATEAVIAAIYEDGGFDQARKVVARIFSANWEKIPIEPMEIDYKSRLQEVCQQYFHDVPAYNVENSTGPEHAKIFEVVLTLPGGQQFRASNSSCKKAERDAAAQALAQIRPEDRQWDF